jgi:peptidylamidoglycolate lyase
MKLYKSALLMSLAVLAGAPAMAQQAPQKGGLDETGPYQVQPFWFKPGIDRWDQPVIAVAVDNANRIIIGNADQKNTQANSLMYNADGTVLPEKSTTSTKPADQKTHAHQIMVLNADGKVIEDWKQWDDLIAIPHSVHINPYDKERHVWVMDRDNHQILEFTNDGKKLVMKLGEKGVSGTDHGHFNKPAGLAFLPDGSFYVADGYVNSRVIKFDKDGKFQLEWGSKGSGPGQFNLVHSVTIDAQHRVYAADRNNNRVQVFDEKGTFIEEWPNIRSATRLVVTNDNALWLAAAAGYNRFAKFDLNGKLMTYWGMTGSAPGLMDNPHQFATDDAGNLFIADAWNNRLQKFVPKPGADKSRLMAPEFKLPAK